MVELPQGIRILNVKSYLNIKNCSLINRIAACFLLTSFLPIGTANLKLIMPIWGIKITKFENRWIRKCMICIRKNLRLRAVMLLGLTGYHHDVKVIFQEQGVAAGNCYAIAIRSFTLQCQPYF